MIVRRRFRPQNIWPYVQTYGAVVLLLPAGAEALPPRLEAVDGVVM